MKKYEELTFTDDYMFCKIMQHNENLCKQIAELIIGKKIGKIIRNEKQKAIDATSDGRGIRMDVYLEDDDSIYNIEMQNVDTKNIAKRARYYQSMMDVENMERGWEYEKLKKSYVIFINQFDMFGEGLPKYTFSNRCHEKSNIEMGDETTKIFINTKGICDTIEPEMKALLLYLYKGKATSDLTKEIDTRVVKARTNSRWEGEFMTLYERYQIERKEGHKQGLEQGLKQGLKQGQMDVITKLIAKGYSLEEICDIVGISIDEYNVAQLNQK